MPLSEKQIKYAKHFVACRNKTESYAKAFETDSTISTIAIVNRAKRLHKNPEVSAYIAKLEAEVIAKITGEKPTREQIIKDLQQAKTLAFNQYTEKNEHSFLKLYTDLTLKLAELIPEEKPEENKTVVQRLVEALEVGKKREAAGWAWFDITPDQRIHLPPDHPLFKTLSESEVYKPTTESQICAFYGLPAFLRLTPEGRKVSAGLSSHSLEHGGGKSGPPDQLGPQQDLCTSGPRKSESADMPQEQEAGGPQKRNAPIYPPASPSRLPGERMPDLADTDHSRSSAMQKPNQLTQEQLREAESDWCNRRAKLNPQF
jgi:phage terminase small subunit